MRRLLIALTGLGLAASVAACGGSAPRPASTPSPPGSSAVAPSPAAPTSTTPPPGPTKVIVIAEENEAESSVLGSGRAPYLDRLAATYGDVTQMQAGYPVGCPSLAAYILLTSGSTHGICDDSPPSAHRLSGDNIFQQVARTGRQWREYAESMLGHCERQNDADERYLVRHAPPPYYASESSRCRRWDVPLGTTRAGALATDLVRGLPAYAFVTPDACDDMHGASGCTGDLVRTGDRWLARWVPRVLASADYRSGHLLVVITWDEGNGSTNHIATIVIAPRIRHARTSIATTYTHCSTLRVAEQVLRLPLLGCAQHAPVYFASALQAS